MKRKQKIILKIVLRPVYALVGAVIFFSIYNHYLLDKSLVNLKLSLRQLDSAKSVADIKKIKGILDDTFLMEIAKQDLDVVSLIKLETATETLNTISSKSQAEGIKQALQDTAAEKEKHKNPILAALDNVVINFLPKGATDDSSALKKTAQKLEQRLGNYRAEALQEKLLELARIYIRLKDFPNATRLLNQCIKESPANPAAVKARVYLGLIYKMQGDFAKAEEMFRQAKEGLSDDLRLFSSFQEADTLNKMGKYNESVDLFEKISELNPSGIVNQLAQFRAGNIYLNDLQDLQKADQSFKKLKNLAPENQLMIAQNYREAGFKLLETAYKLLQTGKEDEAKETFSKAKAQFDLALASTPFNVRDDLKRTIAQKYREVGFRLLEELFWAPEAQAASTQYKHALGLFDDSLSFYSLDSLAHSGKGLALYFLQDTDNALAESKKAKQLDSANEIVRANLGFIFDKMGMKEDAVYEYENAVTIVPDSAMLQYNLGTLYLGSFDIEGAEVSKRNLEKAIACFKKAIEYNPYFPYAYNNHGYALWLKKSYIEAKTQFQKAISLKQDYIDAHYNLGCIYFVLSNETLAKDEFTVVKKLHPNYKKTDWYLQQLQSHIQ